MDRRDSLYLVLIFTEMFLCLVSSESDVYSSRQNQRITNTEIRLDAVSRDISVFRLDILQIWEHLNQVNTTCGECHDSLVSSTLKMSECESQGKSDHEKIMYSAFKLEKQAVRSTIKNIDKNVAKLEEQILADFKSLNQKHVDFNTELNKKMTDIEKAQEDFRALDRYSKSAFIEQGKRIETLENELETYKTAFETKSSELIDTKQKLAEMQELNKKIVNSLYKLLDCPSKWHKFSGACYYFSTTTSNWTDANKNCQKEGAHLVEYEGFDEVKFVLGLVLSIENPWSESKWAGFWAGGSDIDNEGDWVWSGSGKKVNAGFIDWHWPQPDDHKGNEDCMMSCINLEGRWNDAWCPSQQRYVCEKTLLL